MIFPASNKIKVCYCGCPLVMTFTFRKKEYICLDCGRLYEMFGTFSAIDDEDFKARHEALVAEWKEHGSAIVPPAAYKEGCDRCWGDGKTEHASHMTQEEMDAHNEALAWLRKRTGREALDVG